MCVCVCVCVCVRVCSTNTTHSFTNVILQAMGLTVPQGFQKIQIPSLGFLQIDLMYSEKKIICIEEKTKVKTSIIIIVNFPTTSRVVKITIKFNRITGIRAQTTI